MEKTIEIPEGYAARIEGNKVIIERKESEDEKIRKQLIGFLSGRYALCNINTKDAIAYLERQKKQKPMYNLEIPAGDIAPAEEDGPFDEDEFLEGELSAFLQNYDKEYDDDAAVSDVARHFYEIGKKQKEQKSAEWRPIDDEYMSKLCEVIDEYEAERVWKESIKRWLKSLRPSWKPSEEQRHIEGQDTCYLNKQKLVNFIEDCIAENLENTTQENRDNHEGYHQACWDILYFIKQASK